MYSNNIHSSDKPYRASMLSLILLLFAVSKADVPAPQLPSPELWIAGMNYTLTCVLHNLQSLAGLDVLFTLEIRGPDNKLRASQMGTSPNITCNFTPLVVSDGGAYACNGSVFIKQDGSTHFINTTMTTITVEIPLVPLPAIYHITGITYAGSKLLLNCTCSTADALPNQTMVDMSWYRDNKTLLNSNYLLVGPTTLLPPTTYVRRLWFTPVMEQDSGVYSCNVTIRPVVPSTYVYSKVQATSYNLLVTVPTVGVSLAPTSHRTLTLSPYNMIHFMCSATVVAAVTYPFNFSWSLAVNGSSQVDVTNGTNATDPFPPVGFSSVQVTLTTPGVYVYSCSVIISEASASGSSETTITVDGPLLPLSPTSLQALEVNTSCVLVAWTVAKVAFTPEVYKVVFWSPPNVGYHMSAEVNGTSDINAEDMNYTILLTGLTPNLNNYLFQVEAANTVGSTVSGTFQISPPVVASHATPSIAILLASTIVPGLLAAAIMLLLLITVGTAIYRRSISHSGASISDDIEMKDNELYSCQQFKMSENKSYEHVIIK